jgi:hypothetical protein
MNEALPAPQQADPPVIAGATDSGPMADGEASEARSQSPDRTARPPRVTPLASALRRARAESAEHSAAVAEVRLAEIGRLELLAEALAPVLAQTPEECDIFDVAVSPGARPRLFIDQIGFVEMETDRRTYRFLQDTRHGRILLKTADDIDTMVDAITDYIAHRLIEREKALAIDYASGGAARSMGVKPHPAAPLPAKGETRERLWRAYLRGAELVGALLFFGLLAVIGYWAFFTPPAG